MSILSCARFTRFSAPGCTVPFRLYWLLSVLCLGIISLQAHAGAPDDGYVITIKGILSSAPVAPELIEPASYERNIPTSVSFSWSSSESGYFHLQVSTSILFTTTVIDQSRISTTSFSVNGLAHSTGYFWRVRVCREEGECSPWSHIFWFQTMAASPRPTAPANAALNVVRTPVLTWSGIAGATSYRLQVSSSSTFETTVVDQSIQDTSFTAPTLVEGTTYYWRVQTWIGGYNYSAWSDVYHFTVGLKAPVLVAPADGVTGVPKITTFNWNEVEGASYYQFQISTSSTFDAAGVETYRTMEPQLLMALSYNTTYYWRVQGCDAGTCGLWSSTFRFSTILAPPVPGAPANGATNVVRNPTFTWTGSSGATGYELQVSTSISFSSTVLKQRNIVTTSYAASGLSYYTTYYWRVRACDAAGCSAWSSVSSFTTLLAVPALVAPANGATDVTHTPAFSWGSVAGATTYSLQISTSSSFSSTEYLQSNITSTTLYIYAGVVNYYTTYYWRVKACNSGGCGAWSSPFNFTPIPPPPSLVFPADGAMGVALGTELYWIYQWNVAGYQLQVATTNTFAAPIIDLSDLKSGSHRPAGLLYNTTYYWRVRSCGGATCGAWSSTFRFTTAPPPGPALLSPADGAVRVTPTPMFEWAEEPAASSYTLQVSRSSFFSTLDIHQSGLTDTAFTSDVLDYGVTYYWRVRSCIGSNCGAWSSTFRFTTTSSPPPPVVLVSPASLTGLPPTLRWLNTQSATSYNVQVSTSSTFSTTVFNQTGIVGTSIRLPGRLLAHDMQYYWRAQACNAEGCGVWASPYSFVTSSPPPLPRTPTLIAPVSGAQVDTRSPIFTWNFSDNVIDYELQISTDPAFASTEVYVKEISATSYTLDDGLSSYYTLYYWRVRSWNGGGYSAWSPADSFRTPLIPPALYHPLLYATNVPIPTVFRWRDTAGATTYHLIIRREGEVVVDLPGLTNNAYTISDLDYGTRYHWKVRACNSQGCSAWSNEQYFTVMPVPAPVLIFPQHNTPIPVPVGPTTFRWSPVPRATSYTIEVSPSSSFSPKVVNQSGITTASFETSLLTYQTPYYWRVKACNAAGCGDWSSTWRFTTAPPPPAPAGLRSPFNEVTAMAVQDVLFAWSPSPEALEYRFQLSTSSTFGSLVKDVSIGATQWRYVLLDSLSYYTTYYWRVQACNYGGCTNSAVRSFRTKLPPPVLSAPLSGAKGVPTMLTLSWHPVTGASKYRVQVSTTSDFATTVFDVSNLSTNSYSWSNFAYNTTYYWRVCGVEAGGEGEWATGHFTTRVQAPTLIAPLYDATGVALRPTLSWVGASNVLHQLEVSGTSTFDHLIVTAERSGTSVSYVMPVTLSPQTRYYWRVRSVSGEEASEWVVYRFTTGGNAVVLKAPAERGLNVDVRPTFQWNAYDGALEYRLQVSEFQDFSTLAIQATTSGTSYQAPVNLLYNKRYYWRVQAVTQNDSSVWHSPPWSFTTVLKPPILLTPLTNALEVPLDVELSWKAPSDVAAAATYELQLSGQSNFTTTIISQGSLAPSQTRYDLVDLLPNSPYYWRVRYWVGNQVSAWAMRYFRTLSRSDQGIAVHTPQRGETWKIGALYTLHWTDSTASGEGQNVRVDLFQYGRNVSTPAYSTAATTSPAGGDLLWRIPSLSGGDGYTIRVRRTDDPRIQGVSNVFSLTPGAAKPQVPVQKYPAPEAIGISNRPRFEWSSHSLASSYTIQWSPDSLMRESVVSKTVTENFYTPTAAEALMIQKRYYWRVRANSALGVTSWSPIWTFRTGGRPTAITRVFYITDHLGSVRVAVNDSARVVQYADYYPFGMEMPGRANVSGTPAKENFTGHELDDETGMLYAGARYLDPMIGRWMSVDPLADEYPAWSPYVYAFNNPLRLIDPKGLEPEDPLKQKAVEEARKYVEENPNRDRSLYRMGAKGGPGEAVDCSGLVSNAIVSAGGPQLNTGKESSGVKNIIGNTISVSLSEAQPGDIVVLNNEKHVGIVTKIHTNKEGGIVSIDFIHSGTSTGPVEASLNTDGTGYWGQRFDGIRSWSGVEELTGAMSESRVYGPYNMPEVLIQSPGRGLKRMSLAPYAD